MKKNIITILLFSIFFFCIPFRIYASYDAVITGNTVRIRSGAGTNNDAIFTLNSNTSISVVTKNGIKLVIMIRLVMSVVFM